MNSNAIGIGLGFVFAVIVVGLTVWRQRRFDLSDLGSFVGAFLAATNIVPAVLLCSYGFFPDPKAVPSKLHGLEIYISYAGLSLLLVSLIVLWALCAKAYRKPSAQIRRPATGASRRAEAEETTG